MNDLSYNVFTLNENLEDYESIMQFDNSNDLQNFYETNILSTQVLSQQQSSHVIIPWK